MINGCGPYYYRVKSVRQGKKVRQVYLAYLGRSYEKGPENAPVTVLERESEPVKPSEAKRGQFSRLEVEGAKEAKQKKTWDRHRYETNRMISRRANVTMLEADALRKQAWRSDVDPATFDWDTIQGQDMDIQAKQAILSKQFGLQRKEDEDYEDQAAYYLEEQEERRRWREESPEAYAEHTGA
jgi:hypothetical protein